MGVRRTVPGDGGRDDAGAGMSGLRSEGDTLMRELNRLSAENRILKEQVTEFVRQEKKIDEARAVAESLWGLMSMCLTLQPRLAHLPWKVHDDGTNQPG